MKKIFKIENIWILIALGIIIHNYWNGIDTDYYITQFIYTVWFIAMCIGGYLYTKILEEE